MKLSSWLECPHPLLGNATSSTGGNLKDTPTFWVSGAMGRNSG